MRVTAYILRVLTQVGNWACRRRFMSHSIFYITPPSRLRCIYRRIRLYSPKWQTSPARRNGSCQSVSTHPHVYCSPISLPISIAMFRISTDTFDSLEGRLLFAVPKSTPPLPPPTIKIHPKLTPTLPLNRRPPPTGNPRPPHRLRHPISARTPPRHHPSQKPPSGPNLPPRSRHPHLRRRRARAPRNNGCRPSG